MEKKQNRFKFLVYPRFQLAIMYVNGGVLLTALILIGVQIYRSFRELKQIGSLYGFALPPQYFDAIDKIFMRLVGNLGIAVALSVLASCIFTLVFSHRLVGPIVRLRSYFTSITEDGQSRPRKLKFRDGDFFDDLPPAINAAIEQVRKG